MATDTAMGWSVAADGRRDEASGHQEARGNQHAGGTARGRPRNRQYSGGRGQGEPDSAANVLVGDEQDGGHHAVRGRNPVGLAEEGGQEDARDVYTGDIVIR